MGSYYLDDIMLLLQTRGRTRKRGGKVDGGPVPRGRSLYRSTVLDHSACIQSTHAPKSYNTTLSPNFPAKNHVPLLKGRGRIYADMQTHTQ